MLLGGTGDGAERADLRDLWILDPAESRWTEVKTPNPPPMAYNPAVYDAADGAIILFANQGQTWVLRIERP